jgi:hypothetical protein
MIDRTTLLKSTAFRHRLSGIIVYFYTFFGALGFNSPFLTHNNLTLLDILLAFYITLNLKSIISNIIHIQQILLLLFIYSCLVFFSTSANYILGYNDLLNLQSGLRFLSFTLIVIVYFDFLTKTNSYPKIVLCLTLGIAFYVLWYFYSAFVSGYRVLDQFGYFHGEDLIANINVVAFYIAVVFPLGFYIIFFQKNSLLSLNGFQKLILIQCILVLIIASIWTGQKTAVIPLASCVFLFFIHFIFSIDSASLIKFAFGILLLLFIYYITLDYHGFSLNYVIERTSQRMSRQGSIEVRTDYVFYALKDVLSGNLFNIIFGYGKNAFTFLRGINDPHNINVQVFLEIGLLGFVIYILILLKIIRSALSFSKIFGLVFIANYVILSNAIGHAFQSHASWIIFAWILSASWSARRINRS